jgi:hypothetical protein
MSATVRLVGRQVWVRLGRADHLHGARMRGRCSPVSGPIWGTGSRQPWPVALDPAHGEGFALDPPADIDATPIRRVRPVFPGVGGELVEHEPNGLRGSRLQAQLGAADGNTRTNEVGEVRELGANQILDLDPIPFVRTSRS